MLALAFSMASEAVGDDVLPGLWSLSPIGALIGAIVLFYWMLSTGRIIPKSSHDRELAVANKRGDEWKDTALEARAVNQEIRTQNSSLIQSQGVFEQFLRHASASPGDTSRTAWERGNNGLAE